MAVKKSITAKEFDRKFDDGEDVSGYLDWTSARRPGREFERVTLELPACTLMRLDVTRQALIKIWIAERLEIG